MESEQRIMLDERVLRRACDLAAVSMPLVTMPPDIFDLWLRKLADAQEEMLLAGPFTITDKGKVCIVSEITQSSYNINVDGVHVGCTAYNKGLPCRHLMILHIINLYLAASNLPALATSQVRDVFAGQPRGEARREAFDLAQAQGGNW